MRASFHAGIILSLLAGGVARAEPPPAPEAGAGPSCFAPDAKSVHIAKPGCRELLLRFGQRVEYRYNAQGLRDRDYSGNPAPGWLRILYVGDARIAGPGLSEKSTVPRRVESYLGGAAAKVEVINAGVEGYSPVLEATRIRAWIAAYHPTHVLIDVNLGRSIPVDVLYAPFAETDESGNRTVSLQPSAWVKPLAVLLGVDTSQYAGRKKAASWESSAFRMIHTFRCMFSTLTQWRRSMCYGNPTLEALVFLRRSVHDAGAKVIPVLSGGPFSSEVILNPAFDADAFSLFDRVTPRLDLDAEIFLVRFRKNKTPTITVPSNAEASFYFPGSMFLNADGADWYAKTVAFRLKNIFERAANATRGGDPAKEAGMSDSASDGSRR